MVGSISDPDDRIATDLGSKSTTDNIYATNPDLIQQGLNQSDQKCCNEQLTSSYLCQNGRTLMFEDIHEEISSIVIDLSQITN